MPKETADVFRSMIVKAVLRQLGWTQLELAGRLHVHKATVQRWCKEGTVPGYAHAYLNLAIGIQDLLKSAEDRVK